MEFIDLKQQYKVLQKDIDQEIHNVLNHGQYILGPEVFELETMLCDYIGVKHCITCGNGTDALQMVYMAYGIGEGDAVFCPDVTFIASVEPAYMLGATPVFCDIEKDTYNLCAKSLEQQIINVLEKGIHTPKAVVSVDVFGNPCRYEEIREICDKYKLLLIEDAAQSFGGEYYGQKCGSLGDIATTSFFPAKPLGCYGDGGAIFTNSDEIAVMLKSIRFHGKGSSQYDNIRNGINSRLDTIQAAILKVKLKALKEYEMEYRQKVAKKYNEALGGKFQIPFVLDECVSPYAQYALLAPSQEVRDEMIRKLNESNIPNMIYYPTPQHELKVYEDNPYKDADFSISKHYCSHTFSLPMHPYLTIEEQEKIIEGLC